MVQKHLSSTVKKIHLVFKTHLDLGFTDFAQKIQSAYFSEFIPKAIETSRTLRHLGEHYGRSERFVWTTGSWLLYEYLEQANAQERANLERAILDGDIVWHALPFTTHSELLDPELFRFGLKLSQRLDQRFGKHTIAAKMTDVPGHTRGIVPLLAEAGVRFLHIGVNDASTPPDVPDLFVWRASNGAEIIVLYSKNGYGGVFTGSGLEEALAIEHTLDNRNPQSVQDVRHTYLHLQQQFPGAILEASTLDKFAATLLPVQSTLPIVTEELGDTWIHGVGSDPLKVSQYRELSRLRTDWLRQGTFQEEDPAFDRFSRHLLLVPEHTWGMDEKLYLADTVNYDRERFQKARHTPRFTDFASSWDEQRAYLRSAIADLAETPQASEVQQHLAALQPQRPRQLEDGRSTPDSVIHTPHFQVRFDLNTGALVQCVELATGREWASPQQQLGRFRYQMFDQTDYDRFQTEYVRLTEAGAWWMIHDFSKPGIEHVATQSAMVLPQLLSSTIVTHVQEICVLGVYTLPESAVTMYGAPRLLTLEWHFPHNVAEIYLTLQWFEKTATRLPEALWLDFAPLISNVHGWQMEKVSELVDPLDVRMQGARHLHAIDQRVHYHDERGQLSITSLDAPLVAPGGPALLRMTREQPDMTRGMSFNLYNNVWGTNFPMWYDDDARLRFILKFGSTR
ncbi:DUF5054 domain-containing protein [Tengunoibacter tsumagoiensis]|uniref:Glycoside hydrolase family 38 N-terminal domain-containing protein n=1 Tax=Tengunoibacter tsumagoiensis TaxID=2014871 RepID=A0A402A722_9CHLR|nr:DUF5054 domain-containing protein [Tengunoibacter tsumagoiensis]GCE14889.1 hypothetical protein KTT_47480 [Tengunoibacter tsumagoiensis]